VVCPWPGSGEAFALDKAVAVEDAVNGRDSRNRLRIFDAPSLDRFLDLDDKALDLEGDLLGMAITPPRAIGEALETRFPCRD
jgi:hypothetical protein